MTRARVIAVGVVASIAVAIDLFIKRMAVMSFPADSTIAPGTPFALALHQNPGVAFNIPFKMPFIVVATIIIGVLLVRMAWMNWQDRKDRTAAAILILAGGAGNLVDRLSYGFTVDYLLIGSRLAINLSDILILIGVAWLLFGEQRKHSIDNKAENA